MSVLQLDIAVIWKALLPASGCKWQVETLTYGRFYQLETLRMLHGKKSRLAIEALGLRIVPNGTDGVFRMEAGGAYGFAPFYRRRISGWLKSPEI